MKFEGVIFDLDGTLVNSIEDIADSMNFVLSKNGFPLHDLQAYKYFVGEGIRNLVRQAVPEKYRDGKSISNYFDEMVEEYKKHCLDKTHPYDGITQLLNMLTERRLKLAVFSNKADDLTKIIVKKLFANWEFSEIRGSRSEIPRKPDPTGANLISRNLGIFPNKLIYLGDTGIDMKTAKTAGMYAVGVLWGFRNAEELLVNGADSIIKHPLDLLDFL